MKALKLVAAVCALGVSPVLADNWTYSGGVLTDGNW